MNKQVNKQRLKGGTLQTIENNQSGKSRSQIEQHLALGKNLFVPDQKKQTNLTTYTFPHICGQKKLNSRMKLVSTDLYLPCNRWNEKQEKYLIPLHLHQSFNCRGMQIVISSTNHFEQVLLIFLRTNVTDLSGAGERKKNISDLSFLKGYILHQNMIIYDFK